MNKSFSKIRHIQEANRKIEKRFLYEQFYGEFDNKRVEDERIEDNMEMLIRRSKIAQIKAIIDNFESINCDGFFPMQVDEFGNEIRVPENVQIYCEYYRGKSKEDMINILNNLN